MARHSPDTLRSLMRKILEASGSPPEAACIVGNALVDANLAGHDSHGVIRILHYLDQVQSGGLDPTAIPELKIQSGAMATVDGKWGWGQPAMLLATDQAIAMAREFGIGLATVDRCYHIGRVAPYVERIAEQHMVGLAMANAGPAVAPYGGRSRVMGTNPIAWAVPRAESAPPVSLDVATAFVAEGKLRVARARGLPAPPGAVVNQLGHPSIDPNDFYDGGALVAFGAHKGSGFSILAQLLGRGLAGMNPARLAAHRGGNGPVVIAIDVNRLTPLETFLEAVESQIDDIHGAHPAEGFEQVLIPGEPESRERDHRMREGVDVPEPIWDELVAAATSLGIVDIAVS